MTDEQPAPWEMPVPVRVPMWWLASLLVMGAFTVALSAAGVFISYQTMLYAQAAAESSLSAADGMTVIARILCALVGCGVQQ